MTAFLVIRVFAIADNQYVLWNTLNSAESAVVLDYTAQAQPIFLARSFDNGRTVPALYIPDFGRQKLYTFRDDSVVVVEAKDAQVRLRAQLSLTSLKRPF